MLNVVLIHLTGYRIQLSVSLQSLYRANFASFLIPQFLSSPFALDNADVQSYCVCEQ